MSLPSPDKIFFLSWEINVVTVPLNKVLFCAVIFYCNKYEFKWIARKHPSGSCNTWLFICYQSTEPARRKRWTSTCQILNSYPMWARNWQRSFSLKVAWAKSQSLFFCFFLTKAFCQIILFLWLDLGTEFWTVSNVLTKLECIINSKIQTYWRPWIDL